MNSTDTENAFRTLGHLMKRKLDQEGGDGNGTTVSIMRLDDRYIVNTGTNFKRSRIYDTWEEAAEAAHKVLHPDLKEGH